MLVKPTVPELLTKTENRYRLVIATSKRAREIAKGSKPVCKNKETSPISSAANEIYENKILIYNKNQWEQILEDKRKDEAVQKKLQETMEQNI